MLTGEALLPGVVRNPLTAALAAMALQTAAGSMFGWPSPSVAVLLAGVWAASRTGGRRKIPTALGSLIGLAVGVPDFVPLPLLAAGLAAIAATAMPGTDDPLRNLAVAMPALTVLALALMI